MDKSSSDVAAEGAILNEMLEIVAKRAALRPSDSAATTSKSFDDVSPNFFNAHAILTNNHWKTFGMLSQIPYLAQFLVCSLVALFLSIFFNYYF